MKRFISLLAAALVLFTAGIALAETYYVNVAARSDLNVRQGRGYDKKVIGHLLRKEKVDVKKTHDDGWMEISYQKGTAYVRKEFLSKKEPSGESGKNAFPTLKLQSKDPAVKTLQRNLNTILGTDLKVSGKFDKDTKALVCQFQRENDLKEDGIVGPKTWAKIIDLR